MPQEWFYSQVDQKVGPVSVQELKRAAAEGTLQPTDLVWTEGMADWQEARAVKALAGLWGHPTAVPRVAAPPAPANRTAAARKVVAAPPADPTSNARTGPATVMQQWWLIGLSLFCCFPAGLVLVWLHPRMTGSTKWIITSVVGAFWIGMFGMSHKRQQEVAGEYAVAGRQWAAGEKPAAAETYRKLLDSGYAFLSDQQKPVVYGRLIDHDSESGNAGSAAKLAEQARKRGVVPSAATPAGQAVVAEAQGKNPR